MLQMVRDAFAFRLYELTTVTSENPSMASHLLFDSNTVNSYEQSSIIPLFQDEILVKLYLNNSKVYTYRHLTSTAVPIWPGLLT